MPERKKKANAKSERTMERDGRSYIYKGITYRTAD
jgi:hypothetical protein